MFETSTVTTTSNVDPGVAAGFMAFFAAYFLVMMAVAVFIIICMWKIYVKAGKPGWASLVPFYNIYVLVEMVGRPAWFFWTLIGLIVASMIPIIGILTAIALLVMEVILMIDLAKAFGKGTGFAVLLILLPIVGYPMLAFGSAKYTGPAAPAASVATPPAPPADATPQS